MPSTEMLDRMPLAQGRGPRVDQLDATPGSEAGLSSVEFVVAGRYAYGLLLSGACTGWCA